MTPLYPAEKLDDLAALAAYVSRALLEIRRLHAANVELLEVLNAIVRSAELNQAAINTSLLIDARAAIAKHGSTS